MRLAHVMSAARIVSSKSGVRHLHDSCTQHEKCRRIFKHVLGRYDIFLRLSYATFVARAARVKQRSYTSRHSNILIVATTVVGF